MWFFPIRAALGQGAADVVEAGGRLTVGLRRAHQRGPAARWSSGSVVTEPSREGVGDGLFGR
jgi:hypothetical protein